MYVYFANLGQDKNTPHMRANSSPLDYRGSSARAAATGPHKRVQFQTWT